jgi:hypothetical protein
MILLVISAASSSSKKATKSTATTHPNSGCGTKATEGCTPHVGPRGTVRVDTLDWTLTDAYQAPSVPTTEQHAPEGDSYVIAFLKVHSGKNETVTLTSEVATTKVGKRTYKQDSAALAEWSYAPSPSLLLQQIEVGETLRLTAIFRLPSTELSHHPELQFNELGFGETHAYIALAQPIRSEVK